MEPCITLLITLLKSHIPVLENLDPSYNYLLVIPNNTLNGTPSLGWWTLDMMELQFWGSHAFWAKQSFSKVKLQVNVLEFLYSVVLMVLLYLDGDLPNTLRSTAPTFMMLSFVLSLILCGCKLSKLPHTFFCLLNIGFISLLSSPLYRNLHTWICAHTCVHWQWLLYIKFGYTHNDSFISSLDVTLLIWVVYVSFSGKIKMCDGSHWHMIKGITLFVKWWIAQSWALWSVWRDVAYRLQCFGGKLQPILC